MWHFKSTPEWRAEIEQVSFITAQPVPTRVYLHVLSFMTDQPVAALWEKWGKTGKEEHGATPWWPFDQVWSELTAQRPHS
jgi:hypothetical protein